MFVRVKTTPNSPRKSVQIVRSTREGSKVRQAIVRHVGIAMDDDELESLRNLAERIKAKLEHASQPSLLPPEEVARQVIEQRRRDEAGRSPLPVDLGELEEVQRLTVGVHEAYGALWRELGLDRVLPRSVYRSASDALFHTAMARLANPCSKRASSRRLAEEFGVRLPLERIYRMMDRLDDGRIRKLQRIALERATDMLGRRPDVLLFDCTTLHFESFAVDGLRQPGFSKNGKHRESQVLLALMVTPEGLPIGWEVLPGASFEGGSLVPAIQRLRAIHDLRRVICVADRGMMSAANLEALEAAGCFYIVGEKLKALPAAAKEQALDLAAFGEPDAAGERIRELRHRGRRVIVRFSPRRAEKDRSDRGKAIEKLRRRLARSANPVSLLSSRGWSKFLRAEGRARVEVDPEKEEKAARWDGLHGVATNLKDMPAREVLAHYKGLWQVEAVFRVTKHDLKVRPIFHWTPRRIRAHIAIAFACLVCARHMAWRMRIQQRAVSEEAIREALVRVGCSVLESRSDGRRFAVPSSMGPVARKVYRIMGLRRSARPFELAVPPKRHSS